MPIGIDSFRQAALQPAERITVQNGDLVAGTKGGLLDRFTGWITGQTARDNRAAFHALHDAVVQAYGNAGEQAFGAVGGKLALGKRLDTATVQQVLTTAERLNTLGTARKAELDRLLTHPAGSDALAKSVVTLGLLGEGSARLTDFPVEIWTAKNLTPDTRALDFYQVSAQILALDQDRATFLDGLKTAGGQPLPQAERDLVARRLDQAVDIARTGQALQADQFKAGYAEGLTKHMMGIRDAGIVQRFPGGMVCPRGDESAGHLQDADGRAFDHCRGSDSHVGRIDQYMRQFGLQQSTIAKWGADQGSDSWSQGAQALKYVLAQQRNVGMDAYWMGQGRTLAGNATAGDVQRHFQGQVERFCQRAKVSEHQLLGSIQAWHALNIEFLARVDLPGNDRQAKTLEVHRTESDVAMQSALRNGLQPGGQVTLKRGPAESGSLIEPVSVFGTHHTVQQVPHHRVFAGYYFERSPGAGHTTFLADHEKEILFMPHGVSATYQGQGGPRQPPLDDLF